MKGFAYKDDDEEFFKLNELQAMHDFQRGFMRLGDDVPSDDTEETIPPTEFYDKLETLNENGDWLESVAVLADFATYLYKNGFDDADEFQRRGMYDVIKNMCMVPDTEYEPIAPHAFHVFCLLQSKGPARPDELMQPEFLDFCLLFVERRLHTCYYALTCLVNYCALGADQTLHLMSKFSMKKVHQFFEDERDPTAKEVVVDLAWRYSKVATQPRDIDSLVKLAKRVIVEQHSYCYHSAYWILVRMLRHINGIADSIMTEEILGYADLGMRAKVREARIPVMIFISYVYELGFELPCLPAHKIVKNLRSGSNRMLQRQACRTCIKLATKTPFVIPKLLDNGIYGAISEGMDEAHYNDKMELGLLACYLIREGGFEASRRVYHTGAINLWLRLFEFEDEELSREAMASINTIFGFLNHINTVLRKRMLKRFCESDGQQILELVAQDECDDIALPARQFLEQYAMLLEYEEHVRHEEEEDEERCRREEDARAWEKWERHEMKKQERMMREEEMDE